MSTAPKLTPFSYVILVLVGEGGAGPHDLVRMMRDGRLYWTAPESQYYAEPKRLAAAGLLDAAKQPGRTHAKTHYTLTHQGREALAEWLATPARFARIQNEAVARLLGAEYADRGVLLESLTSLEAEVDEMAQALALAAERETQLPHRARALAINRRLAQCILEAHRECDRCGAQRRVERLCSPFLSIGGWGRLPLRLGLPTGGGPVRSPMGFFSTSPVSVAATWPSTSAPPTRSSTSAVAASS